MFRLLHLADVHLGAPLGGFGRDAGPRAEEVLDAFRALPDVAIEGGAEAVLIAGDLFDGPRPPETTIIAVREVIRRLVDSSIPVFAVPGNHDARALNPDLYPAALEGATVFLEPRFGEPASHTMGDRQLYVYGVGYDPAEEPNPLSTFRRVRGDGVHVVLLHGSTPGAPHWDGGSSLSISWEQLAGIDVDYVALGDLHRFRGPAEFDDMPACYCGSFAAVDLTEAGLRGPVWVDVSAEGPPHVEPRSSGVREVGESITVDVSGCASDLEVAELVTASVGSAYPVVVLEGEPAFPLDADSVRAVLDERFGASSLADRSRFFDLNRLEEIASQNTVAGHVARLGIRAVEEADDNAERRTAEQGLRLALRVMEVS